jgi:K(+)-stimulated pyrophosphate-energized sodium pump
VISITTEYYTSVEHSPARHIAEKAQTGAATVIIEGLASSMMSIMIPILAVSAAVLVSYHLGGLYGIAMASVGMLSLVGIILSTDTYGPIVDNAAGITEMTKMGKKVRENAEGLDAIGNTTAAINKGFAIGSAAFTVIVLFAAYTQVMGISMINIMNPYVVAGLFIGGMLPFIISAFGLRAVGRSAFDIVNEIRRQFRNPAIMKGTKAPDYEKCITICTNSALRGMLPSGIIAIAAPLLVGFFMGKAALGGMLAGAMVTAFALALMMANAGGAWDNAKKYIETGKYGGKGSDVHAAAVVGDTVGDPFKDTSGPSLNILIKLMSVVALVFLPLFM